MSDSKGFTIRFENRLLAAVPSEEYERLSPNLELVSFPKSRILYEAGDTMQCAYFLNSGMASFLAITEKGQTIDIGMVGNEGFIGDDIIAKVGVTPCRVMTQFPCEALRVEAEPLLAEFNRGGKLQELLLRYTHVLKAQLVQASVCLPFHNYRQRLCRWLLVTSDCLQSDSFRSDAGAYCDYAREAPQPHQHRGHRAKAAWLDRLQPARPDEDPRSQRARSCGVRRRSHYQRKS
jgi:CRP-like cAMP-binding protein